jgi:hypothetical protein
MTTATQLGCIHLTVKEKLGLLRARALELGTPFHVLCGVSRVAFSRWENHGIADLQDRNRKVLIDASCGWITEADFVVAEKEQREARMLSGLPAKGRKGRKRGAKNKPKEVAPAPLLETLAPFLDI